MSTVNPFAASVTHLSSQGFGVVRDHNGQVYFVRGVWVGDRGLFSATEERDDRYQFAQLTSLLEPSAERQTPACPHLGLEQKKCYGCPWMIADYAAQLRQKQHRVAHALARAGFSGSPIDPIWPAPEQFGYRARAQFKSDGKVIGYAGRQGFEIAPIEGCIVLSKRMQEQLRDLRASLPNPAFTPGPGYKWNFLDLDEESKLDELQINRRRAFRQANPQQNQRMKEWLAKELRSLAHRGPLLELFAGSGNFTSVALSEGFAPIRAFEVAASAVEELRNLGEDSLHALRLDLYHRAASRRIAHQAQNSRVLIVNPPRAGLLHLAKLPRDLSELETVFYISCEPQSLAQDLKTLSKQDFELTKVQALDQVPHTPHVEVLVRLDRKI